MLNLNFLRSNIATVGQEPVLFSTTIGENIRYGNPEASDKEVVAAARSSGAHDFIAKLPQGYNTLVGEKGSQLSGGQKQRIAIARALIQNPKILLLDEATSALDYQSEKFVQETLDQASKGRTTIVVSHRLSAIRSADRILFIDKGVVIEDGTHTQLMALKGRYHEMVSANTFKDEYEDDNEFIVNENKLNECHENQPKIATKHMFNEHNDNDHDYFRDVNIDDMENNEKQPDDIQYWRVLKRILKLLRPEWWIMFVAAVASVLIGATLPTFAVLFAEVYGVSNYLTKCIYSGFKTKHFFVMNTGIIIGRRRKGMEPYDLPLHYFLGCWCSHTCCSHITDVLVRKGEHQSNDEAPVNRKYTE